MCIHKVYYYRAYPNIRERKYINGQHGSCRLIYNKSIHIWNHRYKTRGESLSFTKHISPLIAVARKSRKYGWMGQYESDAQIASLRQAKTAADRFMSKKGGFPKFKSRHGRQTSHHRYGIAIDAENGRARIQKLGWFKARIHRKPEGKLKEITLIRNNLGQYYIAARYEIDREYPEPPKVVDEKKIIAIDLGIRDFAVLSNGMRIPNPHYLEKDLKYVRHLSKEVSRKVRGSNNYYDSLYKLGKLKKKIKNRRMHFHRNLIKYLVENFDVIIVEDLYPQEMLKEKNKRLNCAIYDCGWREFLTFLEYKCKEHGKHFIKVDKDFPSSQICSECGYVNKDLKIHHRSWVCPHCMTRWDRDINATKNLNKEGSKKLMASGCSIKKETSETSS